MSKATKKKSKEVAAEETPVEAMNAQETQAEATPVVDSIYAVKVEDAGTLRKKVTIEIPREKIDGKLSEMFGELSQNALIPGFRVGHAPRRLIEKRFGKEVGEDVRNALVSEALGNTLEKQKLQVVGEPELKLEEITVPEAGPLTFSFEIEVAPEFDLPEWKGIEIKRPVAKIDDEKIEKTLQNYRRAYGQLKVVDEPAQEADIVTADVKITGEGIEISKEDQQMRLSAWQVEGILLDDLAKVLAGVKAGQSRQAKATVPQPHANEAWRGKEVTIDIAVKEVKRLDMPPVEAVASQAGYGSVEELREAVKGRLEGEIGGQQHEAMHGQVLKYLLDNTKLDVPEGVAQRHAKTLLARRYMELVYRGIPREQIDQNLQQLAAGASTQAVDEMKLSFVLGKIANLNDIDVDDAEANARIAQLAARQNRRPERVRQELVNDGRLEELYIALRDEKVIDKILESAKVVDVTPEELQAEQAAKQPAEKKE